MAKPAWVTAIALDSFRYSLPCRPKKKKEEGTTAEVLAPVVGCRRRPPPLRAAPLPAHHLLTYIVPSHTQTNPPPSIPRRDPPLAHCPPTSLSLTLPSQLTFSPLSTLLQPTFNFIDRLRASSSLSSLSSSSSKHKHITTTAYQPTYPDRYTPPLFFLSFSFSFFLLFF